MVTIEELFAQIEALEKQLKALKETGSNLTILKSSSVKKLLTKIKSLKKQLKSLKAVNLGLKAFKPSLINKQFCKELSEAQQSGRKIINKGRSKRIEIGINDSNLVPDLEIILSDINGYEIEIIDCQKIKEQENIVQRKYKDDLASGKIGAIGGIPPDGWINLAKFAFIILFEWSLRHTLSDIDKTLWDGLKARLIALYGLIADKSIKEKPDFTVVASYKVSERNQPTILFIFPPGIPKIEMEKEFNIMADILKKTADEYISGNKDISVFEFTYNLSTKEWDLKTQKRFDI